MEIPMTSIRKFTFAALLAAATFTLAPSSASAQAPARGHFTLTHDVLFGNTRIPAGDYAFSYDPQNTAPFLNLSKMSGPRAGFIVMVPSTEGIPTRHGSRLVLASSASGSYVTSMELPECDLTLHFYTPSGAAEKQIAKAVTSAPAGQ
jgi:hypothetical protein